MANGKFSYYAYLSDKGTAYRVRLSEKKALVGGFQPAGADVPRLPRGIKMRHVKGIHPASGLQQRVAVPNTGATLWLNLTTFQVDGKTFEIVGRVGERRRVI